MIPTTIRPTWRRHQIQPVHRRLSFVSSLAFDEVEDLAMMALMVTIVAF
jgi:hypothetical protein